MASSRAAFRPRRSTARTAIEEKRQVARQVESGELRLLYMSPERLVTPRTLDFLANQNVSFFAIDEAHCISAWGHDFRPEYRGLRTLRERFPNVAVHAYTATATDQVRRDIVKQLGSARSGNPRRRLSPRQPAIPCRTPRTRAGATLRSDRSLSRPIGHRVLHYASGSRSHDGRSCGNWAIPRFRITPA